MNLGAIGYPTIYSLDIELLTRLYGLIPLSLKIGVLQQLKMLYITGMGTLNLFVHNFRSSHGKDLH